MALAKRLSEDLELLRLRYHNTQCQHFDTIECWKNDCNLMWMVNCPECSELLQLLEDGTEVCAECGWDTDRLLQPPPPKECPAWVAYLFVSVVAVVIAALIILFCWGLGALLIDDSATASYRHIPTSQRTYNILEQNYRLHQELMKAAEAKRTLIIEEQARLTEEGGVVVFQDEHTVAYRMPDGTTRFITPNQ